MQAKSAQNTSSYSDRYHLSIPLFFKCSRRSEVIVIYLSLMLVLRGLRVSNSFFTRRTVRSRYKDRL